MAEGVLSILLESVVGFVQREVTAVASARKAFIKLEQKLKAVQPILRDAQTKQFHSKEVKDWILRLNDVAYDALDTIHLYWNQRSKAGNLLSRNFRNISSLHDLSKAVKEMNERLSVLYEEKDLYGLVPLMDGSRTVTRNMSRGFSERCHTTGAITELNIVGREKDEELIVKWLVAEAVQQMGENAATVGAIVGMGGVGKATLAKVVYNNPTVSTRFEKRMWVCVSESPKQLDLFKKILEEVGGERCSNDQSIGLNSFQSQINKHLKDTRFLLVLDDVWDCGWWQEMRGLWGGVRSGSRVLITTRDSGVASSLKSDRSHQLRGLSDEQSWRVFANEALREGESEQQLDGVRDIAEDIVGRCGGLPLALSTVGGMMRLKDRRRPVWQDVLSSSIWGWKGPRNENNVFAAIAVSYISIPFYLQQCLTYCCRFPKDFSMDGNNLVRLWMAEGFVAKEEGTELEVLAQGYLEALVGCNLVQMNERGYYTLHDVVHDFALYIRGEEHITPDDLLGISEKSHPHARAFSLVNGEECRFEILAKRKLRSLVLHQVNRFSVNDSTVFRRSLRVLDLSWSRMSDLPTSIGDLALLKYLNLWGTKLFELPDSIVKLRDLQTLDLSFSHVKRLPDNISSLVSLRHLSLQGTCFLECLPKGIGNLTGLQTLGKFTVGHSAGADERRGCSLGELQNLNNLRGKLEIEHLERACSIEESQRARLENKEYLQRLKLSCDRSTIMEFDEAFSRKIEQVYEALQPPRGISSLEISCYAGVTLPSWMNLTTRRFCCLEELIIEDCKFLEGLPILGDLPNLLTLHISGLDGVRVLDTDVQVSAEHVGFPMLERLSLVNMQNLEEWRFSASREIMPRVRSLRIQNCPKLRTAPFFLTLEDLLIDEAPSWEGWAVTKGGELPRLKRVEVLSPCLNLRHLVGCPVLEHLHVVGCDELIELPCSTALQKVLITNCSKACFSVTEDAVCELQNLTHLELVGSPKMCTLLEGIPHMKQLESLVVEDCPGAITLPDGFDSIRLKKLILRDLPQLESFPSTLFHSLKTLEHVKLGPEVGSIPTTGFLERLVISRLKHLTVCGFEDLGRTDLFNEMFRRTCHLEELVIEDCPSLFLSLVHALQEHVPPKLRFLHISCARKDAPDGSSWCRPLFFSFSINSLEMSNEISRLVQLRNKVEAVSIRLMSGLESIPEWVLQFDKLLSFTVTKSDGITELPNWLNRLSNLGMLSLDCLPELRSLPPAMGTQLTYIRISSCPNLSSLPDWLPRLPRLEFLIIEDCDSLVSRCQKEDWNKIRHLPNLDLQ